MCKIFSILMLSSILLFGCDQKTTPAAESTQPAVLPPPEVKLPTIGIASRVASRLPRIHLNRNPMDDTIATNALALFIDSLDYDHTFFLASDIQEFRQHALDLDNEVLAGDISFSQTVFERFKERVTNRVAYVNTLLDKGFDLEKDETYRWKRDDAPWAANKKEWDDLWRKKVKNDYISRLAAKEAGLDDEKAEETNTVSATDDALLSPEEFVRERYKQYQLLVENNYDSEMLLQLYLSSFTRSYDPHSDYLSPRGVEDFDINMSLSLVGIGALLRSKDGTAEITRIIAGGPAEKDGRLQAGDRIVAVAQGNEKPVSILFWPLSRAVRLIRGEKGTHVTLTVIPADDATGTRTKLIDLVRDEVKLEEQAAKGEVREQPTACGKLNRFGILTLPEFYADFEASREGDKEARRCSKDVRRILDEFSTNSISGVLLDLRNDGGGSLAEAIDITGQFIPLGPVVQVREQRGVSVLRDRDPSTVYDGPLVVLVNRLSASASEIVAAALQDYDRAVIVGGRKTHGKGTVQTVYPLSIFKDDLGSLKVTTAAFYRIVGGSTQIKGVTPDIVLPSLYDAIKIGEETLPNALPWSRVNTASFTEWEHPVTPYLPELRERSEKRVAEEPEFKNYRERIAKLQERMDNPEVSLKLSDRIEEIRSEKELEDIQGSLAGTDDKKEDDPVLDEAVRILADLAKLSSTNTVTSKTSDPVD